MPAIQVARTDTFETQRVKINEIGSQVFSITQGGSDLATGNLKLGDGTRTSPSLAFTSDASLGIYKPEENTFGFVSAGKKLSDLSQEAFYSYRDFIIQKNLLNPSEISTLNNGSNYDSGTYSNVLIVGGSGDGATLNLVVTEFSGSVSNIGYDYTIGSYSNIPLVGGNGSGSIASFSVEGIEGFISNAGSGYVPGTYTNIDLTGGSGSGGTTADITITGDTNLSGSISNPGSGYVPGIYNNISVYNNPSQIFVLTSVANPGTPPPNNVYQIDGNTQQQLTLTIGNTYRFDISDPSNETHPLIFETLSAESLSGLDYVIRQSGLMGQPNSFIDLTIKPSATPGTIRYNCSAHNGMGANITVISGSSGNYGSFATATAEVDSSGSVISLQFDNSGVDYKQNDVISLSPIDLGNSGGGFLYTILSVSYTGTVTSITITNTGTGYLIDDVLSANSSDLGGVGSSFEYTINNNPRSIVDFSFTNKGTGYQLNDTISLPKTVSNVSTILPGVIENISTTVDSSSAIVTVASTSGISAGMLVNNDRLNDIGAIADNTTVLSVDSPTQITLSLLPTTSGSVVLRFSSPTNLTEISVSSVDGILLNSIVNKISGSGILAANTTVVNIDASQNIIQLSQQADFPGDVILDFIPPFGDPSIDFEYSIDTLGPVETWSISNAGNGYSVGDLLSVNPYDLSQPITINVINRSIAKVTFANTIPSSTFSVGDNIARKSGIIGVILQPLTPPPLNQTIISGISTTLSSTSTVITVSSTTGITQGMVVTVEPGSTGDLDPGTTVFSVDSSTQITLSQNPRISGAATLTFSSDESGTFVAVSSSSSGSGVGATFDVVREQDGTISSVSINDGGYFYQDNETITILGSDIGGTSPTHDLSFDVSSVITYPDLTVREVGINGANISYVLLDYDAISTGDFLVISGTTSPEYEVATSSGLLYRYFIDDGNGFTLTPDLTFYVGNTYLFDLSDPSNNGHVFSLSEYRDGKWSPSLIENISTTLLTTSSDITVSDATGILVGMEVTVTSGSGQLLTGTKVQSINGNIITLDTTPLGDGAVVLSFRGVEYTDGVIRSNDFLSLRVTENTPNLYYYCSTNDTSHSDEGGEDLSEALITIDPNNTRVFGSGFQISVLDLDSEDVISGNVNTGVFTANSIISDIAEVVDITATQSLTCSNIIGDEISLNEISSTLLNINSPSTNISGGVNIGSTIQISSSSGNITTSGILKTTNSLNVNDALTITNSSISSTTGNDVLLSPATGRVAKVNTNTALIIPAGNSSQRPTGGIVANGAIRFNTDSGQYEGYNASTTSWASLGGVRDLDGNTYIAAEASVGANDNTLYFFNDGNNTVSVTPNYLQFVNVKKIRSVNTTAPTYTDYTTNTQVTLGQYLKYRNNIYEVTAAGQTGTSGNEPTHTTGAASNGTAELTWYASAVAPLTFEEVEEVRIDPLGFTDLVVNNELRFSNNVISTDLQDLIIRPNAGKKITLDATSSLVVPVGDINQRGVAAQGSIRYNTTISQYEGYDGSNWTSLGGVKDVDGNTYIIPETAPGANENILYFYNDGVNTMRLSTNSLEFTNIDAITSQNNNLDIEAQTVTFNNLAATIDTSGTSTFISTTKDNLDFGLAVGLNVDPLLRLDINGDIYLNKAFGTGSFDGIKLFNSDLSTLELSDLAISSDDISLIKGGTNSGASTLYDPTRDSGAKVTVSIVNQTTGDKEMIEYQVIDKGSDIYHTEIGNLNTGVNLVSSVFDFDANNNVRVTFTLEDLTIGDVVNITVVKTIFKK